jgi:8-oxo-dGTP pyrophosphatase MutT (NUDIX family)
MSIKMANLFNVGIKGLIENTEGKILVLKSSLKGHRLPTEAYWDIPGGRIEEDEHLLEVLKREIEEETGINEFKKEVEFFHAVISNHKIPFEDKVLGLVLMVYKVQIPEGSKVNLSDEHIAYEWVDKAEAAKRLSHKYPAEFTQLLV